MVQQLRIALTVDVEQGGKSDYVKRNLIALTKLMEHYEIPATLFITGRMTLKEREILKLFDSIYAAIGIHKHPVEHLSTTITTREADKLINYAKEEQRLFVSEDKIIVKNTLNIKAIMFRAGKLSRSQATLEVLRELGFKIDSSESIPSFFHPEPLWKKPWRPYQRGGILEASVSTFNQQLLNWTFKLKERYLRVVDSGVLISVESHATLHPLLWMKAEEKFLRLKEEGIVFVTLLEALKA